MFHTTKIPVWFPVFKLFINISCMILDIFSFLLDTLLEPFDIHVTCLIFAFSTMFICSITFNEMDVWISFVVRSGKLKKRLTASMIYPFLAFRYVIKGIFPTWYFSWAIFFARVVLLSFARDL